MECPTVFVAALLEPQREGRPRLVSVASGLGGSRGGNGSLLGDLHRCELRSNLESGCDLGGAPPIRSGVILALQGISSTSNVLTARCKGGLPP